MQYHALSVARLGGLVDLIGYIGKALSSTDFDSIALILRVQIQIYIPILLPAPPSIFTPSLPRLHFFSRAVDGPL